MATNDFLAFGTDPSANVMSQGAYAALAQRPTGFVAGLAQSVQLNKVWRQSAVMAAMLGDTILTYGALDALDDGSVENLRINFARTLRDNGTAYVVATGTANAWVLAPTPTLAAYAAGQKLWVLAPATNTSTTVNANVSGLGDKRVKRADGTDPAVGDLVAGKLYPTIYDGTNIRVLASLPSDILAQIAANKALQNIQQTTNGTRTVYSGIVGATTVFTSTFVKKSATSNLVFWAQIPTYVAGATGPAWVRTTIGGTTRAGPGSNNDSSNVRGPTSLNGIISGLGAGNQGWTIELARSDGSAWTATVNPSTTDNAYFPSAGINSVLIIGEVEP